MALLVEFPEQYKIPPFGKGSAPLVVGAKIQPVVVRLADVAMMVFPS